MAAAHNHAYMMEMNASGGEYFWKEIPPENMECVAQNLSLKDRIAFASSHRIIAKRSQSWYRDVCMLSLNIVKPKETRDLTLNVRIPSLLANVDVPMYKLDSFLDFLRTLQLTEIVLHANETDALQIVDRIFASITGQFVESVSLFGKVWNNEEVAMWLKNLPALRSVYWRNYFLESGSIFNTSLGSYFQSAQNLTEIGLKDICSQDLDCLPQSLRTLHIEASNVSLEILRKLSQRNIVSLTFERCAFEYHSRQPLVFEHLKSLRFKEAPLSCFDPEQLELVGFHRQLWADNLEDLVIVAPPSDRVPYGISLMLLSPIRIPEQYKNLVRLEVCDPQVLPAFYEPSYRRGVEFIEQMFACLPGLRCLEKLKFTVKWFSRKSMVLRWDAMSLALTSCAKLRSLTLDGLPEASNLLWLLPVVEACPILSEVCVDETVQLTDHCEVTEQTIEALAQLIERRTQATQLLKLVGQGLMQTTSIANIADGDHIVYATTNMRIARWTATNSEGKSCTVCLLYRQ